MGRFFGFAVLALSFGSALAEEYKVQYVRPSRLLAAMAGLEPKKGVNLYAVTGAQGQIIPLGLSVKADDERSVVIADGVEDDVKKFGEMVKLFDVKPRNIDMSLEFEVPLEKYKSTVQTKIRNNSIWKVSDQAADLTFSVAPRINEDNTITVLFAVGDGAQRRQMIIRTKIGQTVELTLDGLTGLRVRDVAAETGKKDPNMPLMRLKFLALD